MVYKKPIIIEKQDVDTEEWSHYTRVHANINKSRGSEYLSAGAIQSQRQLVFDIRWNPKIKKIVDNTQLYRIYYDGSYFDIVDTDNFKESKYEIRLLGVSSYGG
jgi:SPP1 family predicted phage head-tail adaptor